MGFAAWGAFVAAGWALGRFPRRWRCAGPGCDKRIPRDATACPGCGRRIVGTVKDRMERLDAEEKYLAHQNRPTA